MSVFLKNPLKNKRKNSEDGSSYTTSTPVKPKEKKTKSMSFNEVDSMDEDEDFSASEIDMNRLVSEIEVKANQKRESKKGSKGKPEDQDMETAMEKAFAKILPGMVAAITKSVMEHMDKRIEKFEKKIEDLRSELKQEKIKNAIREDKHEQFARRDCFVVEGIKEVGEGQESAETLISAVSKIGEAIQVRVVKESIGDIHRIGKRGGTRPRPVVVKTNRLVKTSIFQNKKKLRENEKIRQDNTFGERVSVYDDLTMARRTLMKDIKEMNNVEFCYSRDGTVICKLRDGSFKHINNADDLFHLGVDNIDYSKYYRGLMEQAS